MATTDTSLNGFLGGSTAATTSAATSTSGANANTQPFTATASSTIQTTITIETSPIAPTLTSSTTQSSNVVNNATTSIPVQSTGTASPQSSVSKSSNNPSIGAVIGGTVGGLLAGLIFGMLLMFLWKRNKNQKRSHSKAPIERSFNDRKTPDTSERHVSDAPQFAQAWMVHLPQPADDGSLRNKANTLLHQIDLHVENFYSDVDVGALTEATQSSLHFYDTNLLPAPLAVMMTAVRSKKAVIKHCLTYMIIKKVDASRPATDTLLPREIASLPTLLGQSNMANERKNKIAFNEAYSHWRILTAYLRPSTTPMTPDQDAAITTTAHHFIDTFAAWSASTNRPNQRENLTEIIRHATKVGVLLFSQPSLFEFRWAAPQPQSQQAMRLTEFETAPALLKLTDGSGKPLSRQQIMLEAKESESRA